MKGSNRLVVHVWLPLLLLMFTPSQSCRHVDTHATRAPSGTETAGEGRAQTPPPAGGAPRVGTATRAVKTKLPLGSWGGPHVSLSVTEAGAEVEFDCAQGLIERPIELREDGSFEAAGTYTQETGGPAEIGGAAGNVGGANSGRAARYAGRVKGETMTLSVTPEGGQSIGEFNLALGGAARLFKCL